MRTKNSYPKRLGRLGTKSIDMLALVAGLSWLAVMIGLSSRDGGKAILTWLMRGMWGAIFVYATVFLTLHAVFLKTRSANAKASPKEETQEDKRNALADLQAADSGELAKVIAQNVTE